MQHALVKSYTTAVKRSSRTPEPEVLDGYQLSAVAYFELAFGSSQNTTDWLKEINNRCRVAKHLQIPNIDFNAKLDKKFASNFADTEARPFQARFYDDLQKGLIEGMYVLLQGPPIKENFATFVQRRHEWCSSGSSAGQKKDIPSDSKLLENKESTGQNIRVNKRGYYEQLKCDDFIKAFNSVPAEYAKASEKYENVKSRAIYGVEPYHYAISTYGTERIEDSIRRLEGVEKGLTGASTMAAERKRCVISLSYKQELTMLDYSDFNV